MGNDYPSDWNKRRKEVYRRDNHECQECGSRGGSRGNTELHAHHVVPKSEGGSHDHSNLKTLCRDCHNKVHSHQVGGSASEEQDLRDELSLEGSLGVLSWFIGVVVLVLIGQMTDGGMLVITIVSMGIYLHMRNERYGVDFAETAKLWVGLVVVLSLLGLATSSNSFGTIFPRVLFFSCILTSLIVGIGTSPNW